MPQTVKGKLLGIKSSAPTASIDLQNITVILTGPIDGDPNAVKRTETTAQGIYTFDDIPDKARLGDLRIFPLPQIRAALASPSLPNSLKNEAWILTMPPTPDGGYPVKSEMPTLYYQLSDEMGISGPQDLVRRAETVANNALQATQDARDAAGQAANDAAEAMKSAQSAAAGITAAGGSLQDINTQLNLMSAATTNLSAMAVNASVRLPQPTTEAVRNLEYIADFPGGGGSGGGNNGPLSPVTRVEGVMKEILGSLAPKDQPQQYEKALAAVTKRETVNGITTVKVHPRNYSVFALGSGPISREQEELTNAMEEMAETVDGLLDSLEGVPPMANPASVDAFRALIKTTLEELAGALSNRNGIPTRLVQQCFSQLLGPLPAAVVPASPVGGLLGLLWVALGFAGATTNEKQENQILTFNHIRRLLRNLQTTWHDNAGRGSNVGPNPPNFAARFPGANSSLGQARARILQYLENIAHEVRVIREQCDRVGYPSGERDTVIVDQTNGDLSLDDYLNMLDDASTHSLRAYMDAGDLLGITMVLEPYVHILHDIARSNLAANLPPFTLPGVRNSWPLLTRNLLDFYNYVRGV